MKNKNKNIRNIVKASIVIGIALAVMMSGRLDIYGTQQRTANAASLQDFTTTVENTTANLSDVDHIIRINGTFSEPIAMYGVLINFDPIGNLVVTDVTFDDCVGDPGPYNYWWSDTGDYFVMEAYFEPALPAGGGTLFNLVINMGEEATPGMVYLNFSVGEGQTSYYNGDWEYREPIVTNGHLNILAESPPPDTPSTPSGPTEGKVLLEYTYSTNTTDPDEDQVYYKWDWGDEISDWIGPFNSGEIVYASHIWTEPGEYYIKVRAKDIYDVPSEWSDSLTVNINPLFIMRVVNTSGTPGQEGIVVYINGTWTEDIISYGIKLYYDLDDLEFVSCNLDGTVGENPTNYYWGSQNGQFHIFVGKIISAGSGTLVNIVFNIIGTSGRTDLILNATGGSFYNLQSGDQVVAEVVNGHVDILNHPPDAPGTPSGPTGGIVGVEYTYTTNPVTDPDGDEVEYLFDWDNGENSSWISSPSASYAWLVTGTYNITAKARDIPYGAESNLSNPLTVTITNEPPETPIKPSGPTEGKVGEEYTFSTSTTDPEGHQIYYRWMFGEILTPWRGPFESGKEVSENYSWTERGIYEVKVKAKDIYEAESNWSDIHTIHIVAPELAIGEIKGGILQVSAEIKNSGDGDIDDVYWGIAVRGGIFGGINVSANDTIDKLEAGGTEIGIAKPIFGLGKIDIAVTVGASDEDPVIKEASAFVIGPFVLGVKEII